MRVGAELGAAGPTHPEVNAQQDCSDHDDQRDGGIQDDVGVHLALAFSLPAGLGSPSRTLAALLGGHPRRPNLAADHAAQLATRNCSRVLLSDRLGGSLTSRKVHNGLGSLVWIAGEFGALHSPASIAAGMRERQLGPGIKLSHYRWTASVDEAVHAAILLVRVSAHHHAFFQES